jgi:hypothetical protein
MPDDLTPEIGTDEQDPVTPQADPAPTADPEPDIDEQDPDNQPPADPAPAPAPVQPAPVPSVEERYRASSSESLILNSKNKNLESTLKQLTSEDTPNEAELLAEYPDFKTYNAVTQKLMTETLANRKARMRLNLQLIEQEAGRRLEADIKTVTRQPKYAALKGDDKFEDFVLQPKHAGVDIQTLADAYLVRTGKMQAPEEPPAPPAPAPAGGIPRGSGGPRNQKPQKLSLEAAKTLRETNWKEYMRMAKAGLIDDEI